MDLAGVLLITGGVLIASVRGAHNVLRQADKAYVRYRQDIGRAILLGLEVLVAADIIRTVAIRPTLDSVIVLAVIVLVRTFLSISLQIELEGRLPWRREREARPQFDRRSFELPNKD
ncbi:MAG: DUF1622 domain-containing protein [Hyphomicrobium sp.]|nr:DUF1622 domain-containing protein [Hyphomicrobium sp.]